MHSMPPPGAVMHPVNYRASDGMLLHGYVLLPSGLAPGTAPLIAWLHGGPIMRMYDEYNGGIQLLVNRGNAVFVPNFRVSTGYGLDYVLSANGDVGNGRVLADIIDGLDFLLAEGIGYPGRRSRPCRVGMGQPSPLGRTSTRVNGRGDPACERSVDGRPDRGRNR